MTLNTTALDAILHSATQQNTSGLPSVPGVVAMATDRHSTCFESSHGVRQLGSPAPMENNSVLALFSCTKALTATVLMQLLERGELSLHDPVSRYVPKIADIPVLEGFGNDGHAILAPQQQAITIDQLLLHTAGFSYEFFSQNELQYREQQGTPSVVSSSFESLHTVLHHQPGEKWLYGTNIDWLGKVIEQLCGERLGVVLQKQLFEPLGMHDCAFELTPAMQSRLASLHTRNEQGELAPYDLILPQPPAMDMGGHGLYGTIPDYMKFIRMMLNDGRSDSGEQLLQPQTVDMMLSNRLGDLTSGGWTTSMPALANTGEFYPETPKSWGYSFQVNNEATTTGRPAHQAMWAGLANLYYWIDKKTGVGGMWGTQILPFFDAASYQGFVDFETEVYRQLNS